VADENKLSAVLSDFARTLITDFPIQAILDQLVERIADLLPITAAGVTLIDAGRAPYYVAATNTDALRFERLQSAVGDGPCLLAHEIRGAVAAPDLSQDSRFPTFGPRAVAGGLAAVFAFPLNHGEECLGALDLYRDAPGALEPHDMDVAQTLADVTAAYILNAQAREKAGEATQLLYQRSLHDPLTGLPNRLLLQERLSHAAHRATRSHAAAVVLFADLDRFKQVNDVHGHRVGDALLRAVAERLAHLVRPGDTLARVSGDEFVFLFEDLREPQDAELLLERVRAAFTRPFHLADVGLDLRISASVGAAFAGPGEAVTEHLIFEADHAMYKAKRLHTASSAGTSPLSSRLPPAAGLAEQLARALDGDGLQVAYQPIVSLPSGSLVGVEALVRWPDPEAGPISPTLLVQLAEASGLIDKLGKWVLARACQNHTRWRHEHPSRPLDLAVNVSPHQLMDDSYIRSVTSILEEEHVDPRSLVLEVTENVHLHEATMAEANLVGLRDLGIRISLDDFGTGYCSLNYLRQLPVDIVKVDRTFVAGIDDPTTKIIVASLTALAHALSLTIVAEGVETLDHRRQVTELGCEQAQGYLFARPTDAHAISQLAGSTDPIGVPA
jgi:diguanylate cyclase (GGDEF)-like protein